MFQETEEASEQEEAEGQDFQRPPEETPPSFRCAGVKPELNRDDEDEEKLLEKSVVF